MLKSSDYISEERIMGPQNNPELYQAIAADRQNAVSQEFRRRVLLAGTMSDLSTEFQKRDQTQHHLAEPTISTKLYALSLVQRSSMGVAGFNAFSPVTVHNGVLDNVKALEAPHHDEFSHEDELFRTRVVSLIPSEITRNEVDIFGLNFYQPEHGVEDASTKGLVVISKNAEKVGAVVSESRTLSGETVLFAVRNQKSDDAKLYSVAFDDPQNPNNQGFMHSSGITFQSETEARIMLPDSQVIVVKQLIGELQDQAVAELDKSVECLKQVDQDHLNDTERQAVAEAFKASGNFVEDGPVAII